MLLLISSTLIMGAVTGFVFFSDGSELFCGVPGQVVYGLLSIACFALVGVAFWRFGWKLGVIDLTLVLIVSNAALSFCRYFRRRWRWVARLVLSYEGSHLPTHDLGGDFVSLAMPRRTTLSLIIRRYQRSTPCF